MSLLSGLLGLVGLILANLQKNNGYAGKAELFRGSALQYRLIATEMEQEIRLHLNFPTAMRRSKQEEFQCAFDKFGERINRLQDLAKGNRPDSDEQKVILSWLNEKGTEKKSRLWPKAPDQPEICRSLTEVQIQRALYLDTLEATMKELEMS